MKTQLDLKFYSQEELNWLHILKSTPYSARFEKQVRIGKLDELNDNVIGKIKDSYLLFWNNY